MPTGSSHLLRERHSSDPDREVEPMNDITFDGDTVLTGSRTRLRPFRDDDLDPLWELLCNEEVRRLTGTHGRFSRDVSDRWYRSRGETNDRLDLAVADVQTDRCIGEVVLHELDAPNRSCGFRIALLGPAVFGQGYGTEATHLMLDHAFTTVGLHRVELEVFDFNLRARQVYEKLGFVTEGVRREVLRWDGGYHDAVVMGILASDRRRAAHVPLDR